MDEVDELFARIEQLHEDLGRAHLLRKAAIAEEIGVVSMELTRKVLDLIDEILKRIEAIE